MTLNAVAATDVETQTFDSIADGQVCFVGFPVDNGTNFKQFLQVHDVITAPPSTFCHGFLRFDLTDIFAGSTVVSANLTLYQAAFVYFPPTDTMNVTAYGTAVGWTEQSLGYDRWAQDPRDHAGVTGSTEGLSNATTSTFVTWNVTPLVDAWINHVLPNHGFRLGASSGTGLANLRTREALEVNTRPALNVTYIRVVPADPGIHPLDVHIGALGVPTALFLPILGMAILVLVYFGLYAAHNPELVGRRKRERPRFRLRRPRR